jgi:hypothetical protein
VKAPPAKRL